jgi:putative transposase
VLKWFGQKQNEAKQAYRQYVQEGVNDGRRPELVGGGLIRSLGGWSAVKAMRRSMDRELSDERILGSGEFVERIIKEAENRIKCQFPATEHHQDIDAYIGTVCTNEDISVPELRSGSRRNEVSAVRAGIAIMLVKNYGVPLAEVARRVGVSTSAISKIIKRGK